MAKPTALEKRIKRNITAREHLFFAATTPGLKRLCFEELSALPPMGETAAMVDGGVTFRGRLHDMYLANLHLRTANRILMRIADFSAKTFMDLEKRIAGIPWELYLSTVPEPSVTAKHSKLIHSDAIAERFTKGIEKHLAESKPLKTEETLKYPQRLFVRVLDDRFLVSLDTSGELLHKRGLKRTWAKAPIRETLGVAALKLAGYRPDKPLVDPMCGSGTFSIEAAMMAMNVPPGWYREFAFQGWPGFAAGRWAHIRREAEKGFVQVNTHSIFASDKDAEMSLAVKKCVMEFGLSGAVKAANRDFFTLSPGDLIDGPRRGLVIINPPYGLRLGTKSSAGELFEKIGRHLAANWGGWRFAIVTPGTSFTEKLPFKVKAHPFSHGGLSMTLVTGTVK